MKVLFFLTLILITGCFQHQAIMTREGFAEIQTGSSVAALEKQYGKPIAIYSKGNAEIYEYCEKMSIGTTIVEQRQYFIVVAKGKVVDKYQKISNPPPFDAIYTDDPYPSGY